jgi:adenosylcobinamide-GDP ribazoletransferase
MARGPAARRGATARVPLRRLLDPLAAAGLLTVVPLPGRIDRRPAAATIAGFAPVGLALGGVLGGIDAGLAPVLATAPRTALLLAVLAVLTGGMHLDGLMDAADGLFGGATPARRLEIMRDSRVGAYGVAAAALVLLIQFAALASVEHARIQTIVVAVGASRVAGALTLALAAPARGDGLGSAFAVAGRRTGGALALAAVTLAATVLAGMRGVACAAAVALAGALVVLVFNRRVGGMSGDGHGGAVEVSLAVALLALAARP